MTFFSPFLQRDQRPFWLVAAALGFAVGLGSVAPAALAQNQTSSTVQLPSGRATSGLIGNPAPAAAPVPAPTALPISSTPTADIANPYGLSALWLQGDWVAKGCLMLLALMSMASWYAIVSKVLVLRRLRQQTKQSEGIFKNVRLFASRIAQLGLDNPVRYLADAGTVAVHQYAALKPRVDYDTWLIRAIEQALNNLQTRLQGGMAVLATVGTTAPFVGLFGTVWAIYTALVKIGASGQASIDRVAGPVGEALIMTAIGLAVAVPAVFGYNWLLRQNKLAFEGVRSFGAQLHGLLLATTDLTTALPIPPHTAPHTTPPTTPLTAPSTTPSEAPDTAVFATAAPARDKSHDTEASPTIPSALTAGADSLAAHLNAAVVAPKVAG